LHCAWPCTLIRESKFKIPSWTAQQLSLEATKATGHSTNSRIFLWISLVSVMATYYRGADRARSRVCKPTSLPMILALAGPPSVDGMTRQTDIVTRIRSTTSESPGSRLYNWESLRRLQIYLRQKRLGYNTSIWRFYGWVGEGLTPVSNSVLANSSLPGSSSRALRIHQASVRGAKENVKVAR